MQFIVLEFGNLEIWESENLESWHFEILTSETLKYLFSCETGAGANARFDFMDYESRLRSRTHMQNIEITGTQFRRGF